MRWLQILPICCVLLAIAGIGTPGAAQQPITLKLSHFLGPASFFELDFAQPWAKELEARTNGGVKVEICSTASSYRLPQRLSRRACELLPSSRWRSRGQQEI